LKRLATLNLSSTQVTDAGLRDLRKLTSLQHLYLWKSRITNDGVAALRELLPRCHIEQSNLG
jgi:hypothetical protein